MKRYHYTEADFASKEAAQASLLRLVEPLKDFYAQRGILKSVDNQPSIEATTKVITDVLGI